MRVNAKETQKFGKPWTKLTVLYVIELVYIFECGVWGVGFEGIRECGGGVCGGSIPVNWVANEGGGIGEPHSRDIGLFSQESVVGYRQYNKNLQLRTMALIYSRLIVETSVMMGWYIQETWVLCF